MSNWVYGLLPRSCTSFFFCMIRRNRWEKRERNRPLKTWFDQDTRGQNNFWLLKNPYLFALRYYLLKKPFVPNFDGTDFANVFEYFDDDYSWNEKLEIQVFQLLLSTIKSANSRVRNWLGRYTISRSIFAPFCYF